MTLAGHGDRTVSADHIVPPTQPVTYDLVFSTSGQSMWGPGSEASPGDVELELLKKSDTSWAETYEWGDFTDVE